METINAINLESTLEINSFMENIERCLPAKEFKEGTLQGKLVFIPSRKQLLQMSEEGVEYLLNCDDAQSEMIKQYVIQTVPKIETKNTVYVFRNSFGDCTNGGITSKTDIHTLYQDESEARIMSLFGPVLLIVKDRIMNTERTRAVPVIDGEVLASGMFGGNFVYSSDSRFTEPGPIKVFDRFE